MVQRGSLIISFIPAVNPAGIFFSPVMTWMLPTDNASRTKDESGPGDLNRNRNLAIAGNSTATSVCQISRLLLFIWPLKLENSRQGFISCYWQLHRLHKHNREQFLSNRWQLTLTINSLAKTWENREELCLTFESFNTI